MISWSIFGWDHKRIRLDFLSFEVVVECGTHKGEHKIRIYEFIASLHLPSPVAESALSAS